jgi:hypothetical protein
MGHLIRDQAAGDPAAAFVHVLPVIRRHAEARFRYLPAFEREERVAETVAAAFCGLVTLARKGPTSRATAATLADFACRHADADRHVGGRQSSVDVLSRRARKRQRFRVRSLMRMREEPDWREMAVENRKTSPADIAAFRIDFQEWLRTRTARERRIIDCLATGERTTAVADRFGLTPGRVSQLRRRFEQSWTAFTNPVSPIARRAA